MGLAILKEDLATIFEDTSNPEEQDGSDSEDDVNHPPGCLTHAKANSSSVSSNVRACMDTLIEEMMTSSNVAVGVLNDFLNYDKIESKSLNLDISIVNIWNDLEQALSQFKISAESKDIQLSLEFNVDGNPDENEEWDEEKGKFPSSSQELPLSIKEKRVVGDSERIAHVLRNLLSNSIKFTPKGGTSDCLRFRNSIVSVL